jgi:DNA repair protein RadC
VSGNNPHPKKPDENRTHNFFKIQFQNMTPVSIGGNLTDLDKIPEIRVTLSNKVPPAQRPKISSSYEAVKIFRHFWPDDMELRESFMCMYLNRRNRIIGIMLHSTGSTSSCQADIKIIMGTAAKCGAAGLIIAHNHPSGELETSDADNKLTARIKKACESMDMVLLDHMIIIHPEPGKVESYFSYADSGTLYSL